MIKYFKVFGMLFSQALKVYLEYRLNTYGSLLILLLTLLLNLFLIQIVFDHTKTVNGWSKPEAFLVVGLYEIITTVTSALISRSINHLPEYIQRGSLDTLLIKPISSQFALSLRLMRPHQLVASLYGVIVVIYALSTMLIRMDLVTLVLLVFDLIFGLIILYSLYFMLGTLSIWLVKFTSLSDIYTIMSRPLIIPIDFFGKNIAFVLTLLIPLGFIVTVPAAILLNKYPLYFFGLSFFVAMITLFLSHKFWNFALKHYTSASS